MGFRLTRRSQRLIASRTAGSLLLRRPGFQKSKSICFFEIPFESSSLSYIKLPLLYRGNFICGRGGIRTHGDISATTVFKTVAVNRLATLPKIFYPSIIPVLKNKTKEELHKEISKFEVILSQMSSVNMKALEVYEQEETEYEKLVGKKDSLVKEKTDVLTLMNEIETKKKDHFMKTFTQANNHFQRIFSSLFKKGKAYLQLDNQNNPFEDGLSIKVKLKFQNREL